MKIKIDTVTITDEPWYKELSRMTNGMSVPFESGYKTARLVEAATWSRGFHPIIPMAKSVFGQKKEYHLQFNHEEDGLWYVDFPDWPLSRHPLCPWKIPEIHLCEKVLTHVG